MVPISPEIYGAEAVVFDSRRVFDYMQKLQEKREKKALAEQEAFEKYFTEGQKLTPTGVRAQDLAGFDQRRRNWQTFTIQNKDKIAKDPYTRLQANEFFNETVNYVQRSKQATDKLSPAKDMTMDPTKRRSLNLEKVMNSIALHEKPLDDPDRKEIDYNASWYRDPVYDFAKDFESASKGQQKAFLNRIPGTFDPVSGNWKTEEGYLPQSIKQIANNFATSVASDPEKMDYWERQASKNMPVEEVVRLNKILNNYFPNMKVAIDNPLALAMAKSIEQAESLKDQGQQKDMQYAQQLAEKTAKALKTTKADSIQVTGNAFDEIANIKGIYKGVNVKDGIALLNNNPYNGKVVVKGFELPLSVIAPLKAAGLTISKDDKVDVVFKNGKVSSVQPIGKSAVNRTMMENAQLKFSTEPQKGPQMIFGKSSSGGGAYIGVDEYGNPVFED